MKRIYLIIVGIIIIFSFVLISNNEVQAADEEGNFVIVLDPGHGGSDPGASNSTLGLQEAKINYQIALYAKEELEKYEGVKVYLTRYANCPTIKERGEFANKYNADLMVSIHINSGASSARGAEVWVTQDKTQVEYYQKSKEVGEKILGKLQNLGISNRGVSIRSGQPDEWYPSGVVKDYYGIIRYAMDYNIRSILVEHCYISNSEDCKFINSESKLKNIGVADATGIAEAYQLTKKGSGKTGVKSLSVANPEMILQITPDESKPVGEFNLVFNPTNASNKGVEIYSSNSSVAQVSGNQIKGLKQGEATITIISNNNQRMVKCKVIVNKANSTLKEIKLDKTNATLNIDEKITLKATLNPSNFSDKQVYWVSSKPDVVRVWEGGIRGLKKGTSTITAITRTGAKTATCKVTVNDPNNIGEDDLPFEDIQKTDWYYNEVKYVYENGMILGYNDTQFAPNDKLTRGQLVTILWRMENEPDASKLKNTFKDVKTDYYTDAVKWASSKGIVKGYEGQAKFGPNDPIVRQDLAIILNRYAEYKNKKSTATASLKGFKDYKKVADYAKESVEWAVANDVIQGNNWPDGTKTIEPSSNTTRAEVAAMLTNYIKKFNIAK